jgi:hypothetical protein
VGPVVCIVARRSGSSKQEGAAFAVPARMPGPFLLHRVFCIGYSSRHPPLCHRVGFQQPRLFLCFLASEFPRTSSAGGPGYANLPGIGNRVSKKTPTSQSALLPQSVDQPHQQDYYEDDHQNTEYQLDIAVVSSPWSPRPHLLSFPILGFFDEAGVPDLRHGGLVQSAAGSLPAAHGRRLALAVRRQLLQQSSLLPFC